MTTFRTNSIAMNISREMALAHGLATPTPEEVERYNARYREWWEASTAAWGEADSFRASLAEVNDTVARIVLDIHRPIDDDTAECYGCPIDHDEYREPWPCATVAAVSRAIGIEPYTGYLGHRPGPEPTTMPPEGLKPLDLNRLSAFVDEAMTRTLDATTFHGVE